jgi:hypothetical protein
MIKVRMMGTGTGRMNLAVNHLIAAAGFSRTVKEIEGAHRGEPLGPFYDEILSFSIAAVYCSVASLEANINEILLFEKRLKSHVLKDCVNLLIGKTRILEKYEGALSLLHYSAIPKGRRPYTDVTILIRLRNALTHFIPEWENQQEAHSILSSQLRGKFRPSSFLSDTDPIFPKAWATHACTLWAVNSVKQFIHAFEEKAQLPHRLVMFESRLQG